MNEITKIENPLKSGACFDCLNYRKDTNGRDVCCANHIENRTRMCSKISVCSLFYRTYSASGQKMKG